MNLLEYKPLDSMRSSYKKNNIGRTFEIMTLGYKPSLIVECGVLDGYSLYHFAKATKLNSKAEYFNGHVIAYDLFEKFEYNHGSAVDVYNMLRANEVDEYVTILQGDAFEVHSQYAEGEIDLLHMDIANDGNTFLKTVELWGNKISKGGRIVLEGGGAERDEVEWMKKYNKKPIRSVLPIIAARKKWDVKVIKDWPSITVLTRR